MAVQSSQINIRIPDAQRRLIDRAAEDMGVTRTQYMLNAACERAEEQLVEQNEFRLDHESFVELLAVLDAPVVVPDGLRDLMSRRAPWESEE